MSRIARTFCLILASTLTCSALYAQSSAPAVPDNFYSAMQWRCIGPHRGGRVLAVSGVRGEPYTFYFGAVAGGVWKTIDAGRTWTPIFDSQPIASIGALAVSTSDPNIIYVGTGEARIFLLAPAFTSQPTLGKVGRTLDSTIRGRLAAY